MREKSLAHKAKRFARLFNSSTRAGAVRLGLSICIGSFSGMSLAQQDTALSDTQAAPAAGAEQAASAPVPPPRERSDLRLPSTPFAPTNFAYVLQADRLGASRAQAIAELSASDRDLIILDRAYQVGDGGAWSPSDLDRIRAAAPGRRIVAYFSIGEAESYRHYWQPDWTIGKPSFLLEENPNWKGNYVVKYWDRKWQALVLADLDVILAQGFDGVYLDIVDGFSNFERRADGTYHDNRINPRTKRSYRRDMAVFVARIAAHARRYNPQFLVIPQNGAQLLAFDRYVEIVSAIGIEDLLNRGDTPQSAEHFRYVNGYLRRLRAVRKPVLLVEYPERGDLRAQAIRLAGSLGDPLLLVDRPLMTLGRSYRPDPFAAGSPRRSSLPNLSRRAYRPQ